MYFFTVFSIAEKTEKARFRLILLLVNLDTLQILMQELEKMIAYLKCIRIPLRYRKWS